MDTVIALYNEQGHSGQTPNADGFHNDLTLDYITNYATPFDLILRLPNQQREIDKIKGFTTYKPASALAKVLLKIKGR